jgi:zinc protease
MIFLSTKTRLAFFLSLLFLVQSVIAQQTVNEKLPVDPAVKIGKLENGFTYYIRKNERPEKKAELRLVVNVGSILEDDNQQGLAHFTEHMAFNGSKNFKKNDIISFLQSIGVEFGADLNAYTAFDETVYILPIPTEKNENIEKGFQILEDWASTIAFDPTEIDKERGIVLEEERGGKGADERMFRITYPKMLEGSRYAQRLPIGKPEIIKNFKPEVIRKFYTDWYRPDLMAIVVVGDIDPVWIEDLVKKHFGKLKSPKRKRERLNADVPERKTSEGLVVTDKEATNHVVEVYYSYKKEKPTITITDFREQMMRGLIRNMLSQRMQELTQKADPPFIYGASSIGSWARGYEGFSSIAYISQQGPEAAINALVQENERARKFGFTEGELMRIKKMVMKGMERNYNERDKTESHVIVDEYIRHYLQDEPIPGVENEFKYYKDFLDGITLIEVNKISSIIIPPAGDPKLVILTGPDTAEFKIPSHDEILSMAQTASKLEVAPYENKVFSSSLIDKIPVPGKIISESKIESVGITDIKLDNGIRVLLKPTDFKNDQVVLAGTRPGGYYLFDPGNRFNAEYASSVVAQMGMGSYSPMDLRKVLAGKSANVSSRIGTVSESINGSCSATDVETMLQLVYLNFTQPRAESELFASFVNKQQTYYKNMTQDPEFIFQDSLLKILYGKHPWAPLLPKYENFAKLSMNEIIAIHKNRFGDANGFNFVIVGKFDLDSIRPMLQTYLGSLPATAIRSSVKDVGLRPVKGVVKKEIFKGKEEKSQIRLFWNGEAPYTEDEQLKLQILAEVLDIKLTEKLREEMGGIYSGSVYASLNRNPYHYYSIGVTLPCGPENVQKLIQATLEEISRVKSGPSEIDVNKVKETRRQQLLTDKRENAYWLRQVLSAVDAGLSPENVLQYEKRLNAITAKDLQQTANKYFDMENYVQVVLNPEE